VDDFAAWRQYVLEKLRENLNFEVIGIASDGLEAVRKVEELQPDLILLDIGLPKLDGIGAARQIHIVAPESKILFVSQELDLGVAQEALSVGGQGFVVKSEAESELLAAIEAVMLGNRFVSRRLRSHAFADVVDSQADGQSRRAGLIASHPAPAPIARDAGRCHEVQFYANDTFLLDGFTRFISAALKSGNPAIVIATQSHRDSLLQRLRAHGSDIRAAIDEGRLIELDAAETLSTFMVNEMPDPARFLKVVSDLIMAASRTTKREHSRVMACGECAPLLWAEGKADAAIRLEELWDEIARTCAIDILCGYSAGSFRYEEDGHIFRSICQKHSAVHSW
jgi:CheY-like chemotaxis protein